MESQVLDDAFVAACNVARKAGAIHRELCLSGNDIQRKDHFDIVTEADIRAETYIIDELARQFPDHVFSSEERHTTGNKHASWRWILDPLDGTINYVNGLPFYAVSLALQHHDETVLGIVYDVSSDTVYSARKGRGAYKNDMPLQVSPEKHLSNSVLTFMLTSHYSPDEISQVVQLINNLAHKTRGLRLLVSQALELAFIAEGKLQGTVCIKSRGFSAAAGVLLVREAHGQVTDLHGNNFKNTSRSIVATNYFIHEGLLRLITI